MSYSDVKNTRFNNDELEPLFAMIHWLRRHPVHAIYLLTGVTLDAYQRIAIREVWNREYVILLLSRGLGKTFCTSLLIPLINVLYSHSTIVPIAPDLPRSTEFFNEIDQIVMNEKDGQEHRDFMLKSVQKSERGAVTKKGNRPTVRWLNGSYAKTGALGGGKKKSGARGLHANFLLTVDEAQDISVNLWEAVIRPFATVGRRGASSSAVKTVQTGTLQLYNGRYETDVRRVQKLMINGDETVSVVEFNYKDTFYLTDRGFNLTFANYNEAVKKGILYSISSYQIKDTLRSRDDESYREDFIAERCNELAPLSTTFYPYDIVLNMQGLRDKDNELICFNDNDEPTVQGVLQIEETSDDPIVIGIDPASESADTAFVGVKVGALCSPPLSYNSIILTRAFDTKRYNTMDYVNYIYELLDRYPNILYIYMDKGGGGNQIRHILANPEGGRFPIYDPADTNLNTIIDDERAMPILRLDKSTSVTNNDRAHKLRDMIANRRLLGPKDGIGNGVYYDALHKLYVQLSKIGRTPLSSGAKFYILDTIHNKASRGKKDMVSALWLTMAYFLSPDDEQYEDDGHFYFAWV